MTKIYKIFNDLTTDNYKDERDPQLIHDYSSLGTSINIKYIPADNTNVLYFDANVYRLDHGLEHQPIVLYKIPPDTGDDVDDDVDDDWPVAGAGEDAYDKCYYERRQLEIHHHLNNNSGKKLVLVIPFRSSKGLGNFSTNCLNRDPIAYNPDPNGLDLTKLMINIKDQDKVYYEEDGDTITIFYTEQYVDWDVNESFWNGSFMDRPQLLLLDNLCDDDTTYKNYIGCHGNDDIFYDSNEYPDDLSYNDYRVINYTNPYLNYHYLSSENVHKTLTSVTTEIYAIRNGTSNNETILGSTLRSDAAGLGVDTTGGSDDDGADGVDDNEIVIDCSPINTTEEEIMTKLDKDGLLKLNSGYTYNNIIKDITNSINNANNEDANNEDDDDDDGFRSEKNKVKRNQRRRKRNFNVALNRQLKDLERKYIGGGGKYGSARERGARKNYKHYKNNYVVPIAETILGIIIGIISCITFNIILNKVLKKKAS